MLNYLRKSASGIVVKLLLGLLILSFAAWGIGDVFSSKAGRQVVASVGDVEIHPDALKSELNREVDRLKPVLGENFTAEQAKLMGLGDAVLRRMINTALYDLGAKDIGLGISDAVVLSEIQRAPEFRDANGAFSRNIFQQALFSAGMNEAYYVQSVRENMTRRQYLSPLRGAVLPTTLLENLYAFEAEKRVLDVVRIDHAAIKDVSAPTTTDLEDYHNKNQQFFMTPEYRTFTGLVLSTEKVAKTISVDGAALQALYEERLDEFTTGEQRKLSQILVDNEIAATKAADAVTKGRAFDVAAREVGATITKTDIGLFERSQLMPALQDPVFNAVAGTIIGPVKSVLGWHIVRVEAVEPEKILPLSEVTAKLEKIFKAERALDELFELSNRLEDQLGGGMSLEEAARELGMETVRVTADATGKMQDGKPVKLDFGGELAREAFALELGTESPLMEIKNSDAFYIVRLDDIRASELRPLSEVKADVETRWLADARTKSAETEAEKLLALVKGGTSLNEAAPAMGYKVTTSTAFDREGRGLEQPVPAVLVRGAFGLITGESRSAPGTGAHVVVVLKSVQAADSNDKAAVDAVSQKALSDLQNDILNQLSAALQEAHSVSINQRELDEAY